MKRCVIDTNVPIVANGGSGNKAGDPQPSLDCRIEAINFLVDILKTGRICLDLEGTIETEYRKHLRSSGQPGVGDRFYQMVLHSRPGIVERITLPKFSDGEYVDFPGGPDLAKFDPSDRKFAALARRERIPVINATDSDWLEHRAVLKLHRIKVTFLCGCETGNWFV